MRLYISHKCFLCRFVEPLVRRWVQVFKLYPDGRAVQVNGPLVLDGRGIPAVPCLVAGRAVFVGVPALLMRRK